MHKNKLHKIVVLYDSNGNGKRIIFFRALSDRAYPYNEKSAMWLHNRVNLPESQWEYSANRLGSWYKHTFTRK